MYRFRDECIAGRKNRAGRPFGADEFYAIVDKLTGRDTRLRCLGRARCNKVKKGNVSSYSSNFRRHPLVLQISETTLPFT